jgi:hypothetical protein
LNLGISSDGVPSQSVPRNGKSASAGLFGFSFAPWIVGGGGGWALRVISGAYEVEGCLSFDLLRADRAQWAASAKPNTGKEDESGEPVKAYDVPFQRARRGALASRPPVSLKPAQLATRLRRFFRARLEFRATDELKA